MRQLVKGVPMSHPLWEPPDTFHLNAAVGWHGLGDYAATEVRDGWLRDLPGDVFGLA